jgi:ATP-binding cassette subfamily C (CFTR/MRP) protein 5
MAPVTDKRVALMNELINSIRLVKMYAWEKPFFDKIQSVRNDELKLLRRSAFLQSISFSVTPTITIIAAVVTFFCLT